jgi:hypothetical protein
MAPIDRDSRDPAKNADTITPTTPLRLKTAAEIAFPDGSMKLAGLRREIARGRLAYEVIAGKHYTTLADIEDMRRLCRVQAKAAGVKSSQRAGLASRLIREVADKSSAEEATSRLLARLDRALEKRKRPST